MRDTLLIPVVTVSRVFHVGAMNHSLKGARGSSLEAGCLSVSLCPAAWTEIAKLGGNATWCLRRDGAAFLDVLRALRSRALMDVVRGWGTARGLARSEARYRAYQWDSENDEWRFSLHASEEAARSEAEFFRDDEDDSMGRGDRHRPGRGVVDRNVRPMLAVIAEGWHLPFAGSSLAGKEGARSQ